MYFKMLGCTLVLISSSLLGIIYGENLKRRFFQLQEVEQALYQLKNEIIYSHNSLPDIFNNVSRKCKEPISNVFQETSLILHEHKVESVYEAFKVTFKKNNSKLNLREYDIEIVLNLARTLGQLDIEGQQSMMNLALNNIKKQLDSAESIMHKNVKMYRYLGFSFGAILVIMML